jgi:murein DD-endopeptidase MepM/ murein hydrolase activator NlpD
VAVSNADLTTLHAKRLLVPVAGVKAASVPDTFGERRGSRPHAALDILAPRGTPVLSVDAGRVVKRYTSDAGGLTLYVADPSGRFVYYYAHLDRYNPAVVEGGTLARGDTVGFVGTSGNAAPTVPHLHFAIARVADARQWWKGTPVNPHTLLTDQ